MGRFGSTPPAREWRPRPAAERDDERGIGLAAIAIVLARSAPGMGAEVALLASARLQNAEAHRGVEEPPRFAVPAGRP